MGFERVSDIVVGDVEVCRSLVGLDVDLCRWRCLARANVRHEGTGDKFTTNLID